MAYLLDANVFIEAHRRYYAFDICPGFWVALANHNGTGNLKSIDRVKTEEFARGTDGLLNWARTAVPGDFFANSSDTDIIQAYRDAVNWVNSQTRFSQAAKNEYAQSVDGWLIAYAKARGMILVTHEERAPASRNSVKIPDVCDAIGVTCRNTFEMLRDLGSSFILA